MEDEYVFSAFADGVSDYLLKSLHFKDMIAVIRNVVRGQNTIRPEIAKILAASNMKIKSSLLYLIDILVKLSPSEFEILKDAYNGLSYNEIAEKRFVTLSTVKNHALRILKKFRVHSMKEIISDLRELKIFDLISNEDTE